MGVQPPHSSKIMGKKKGHAHPPLSRRAAPPRRAPRPPGPHTTIGELLRSSNLTTPEIRRVESALRQRDLEIDKSKDENDILKDSLSHTKDSLREKTTELENVNKTIDELQERDEGHMALIRFATTVIEKKNAELQHLRAQLNERDSTISCIGMAAPDQATAIANEASAQRTLKMLQGYRIQVIERDEQIKQMTQHLEQTRDQCREHFNDAQTARKQAAEAREIADEQQKLIERLLKDSSS